MQKQTIALVDDDRNILTSLSIALEKEGFKVQTYIDGESALIGLTRTPPDLAIVDIKMPKMDGEELLKRLRKKTSLPVIFLIENNGYGLSTPVKEQYNCDNLSNRGVGYGMPAYTIDGNNVIEVFTKLNSIANDIRKNPHPVLVECQTFRMRGHEEASGVKYVPKELLDKWSLKDPISNFEEFLINKKIITHSFIDNFRKSFKQEIDNAISHAFSEPDIKADKEFELNSVFKDYSINVLQPSLNAKNMRFLDAFSSALRQGMEKYDNLVFMGQDIAEYGGVFKISDGFLDKVI